MTLKNNNGLMNRRKFLATGGSLSISLLAGCIDGMLSSESTEDNGDATEEPTPEDTPTEEDTPEETPTEEDTPEETPTEEALYNQGQEDELLLPIEAFPEGWTRDEERNPDFDVVYMNEDETNAVLIVVGIAETVEQARESFEDGKATYRDPQELDFADQAYWDTRDSQAITTFRHSNAIGQVRGIQETGVEIEPAVNLSQTYAVELFEHWQGKTFGDDEEQTDDSEDDHAEDLINVVDHHFERFAVNDVNAFVTIENISDKELDVRIDVTLFENNLRVARNDLNMIRDLPSGIAEERSNITLTDVKDNDITHYTIEIWACDSDALNCEEEIEPIVMELDGEEFEERLEGEWT